MATKKTSIIQGFSQRMRKLVEDATPEGTVAALGRKVDIDDEVIGQTVRNGKSMSIASILRICNALNLSCDWLLTGNGVMWRATNRADTVQIPHIQGDALSSADLTTHATEAEVSTIAIPAELAGKHPEALFAITVKRNKEQTRTFIIDTSRRMPADLDGCHVAIWDGKQVACRVVRMSENGLPLYVDPDDSNNVIVGSGNGEQLLGKLRYTMVFPVEKV